MYPQTIVSKTILKPLFMSLIFLGGIISTTLQADSIPNPGKTQKEAIDEMHHKLHDDQAPFKAKEAQYLKELNEMTVREDVRMHDINAKIGQLMAAKEQIMRLRYDHLVEMRAILTDEQKVGYDKGVLSRSAVK
jgi:Spy/CpxP family protein refolding chaperone